MNNKTKMISGVAIGIFVFITAFLSANKITFALELEKLVGTDEDVDCFTGNYEKCFHNFAICEKAFGNGSECELVQVEGLGRWCQCTRP